MMNSQVHNQLKCLKGRTLIMHQEECHPERGDNKLEYIKLLMQDVLESSLGTVQRVHSIVLQTNEKGEE